VKVDPNKVPLGTTQNRLTKQSLSAGPRKAGGFGTKLLLDTKKLEKQGTRLLANGKN